MIASSPSPGSTIAAASRTASETVGVRWLLDSGIDAKPTPARPPADLGEDDLGVAARRLGDRAAVVALRRRVGRPQLAPRDQLFEHDRHLLLGEGGAEAAAHAAAERDPGVGAGRRLEEALGTEAIRLRV